MRTERRRYFRIDDTALVKYRVIDAMDLEAARAQIVRHILASDNLRAALEPLDARLTEMGPALRRESRVVAEVLELINRKISLVAGIVVLERVTGTHDPHREHAPSAVNLSGGGLGLRAEEPMASGTWLAVDVVLLPASHAMRAIGRVTDSRKRDTGYWIGIEFDALREEDRDALISHALRKQAQILRQERNGQPRSE